MEKTTLTFNEPFAEDFAVQRVSDTDELQMNFIRLKAGKSLPAHNANSQVRLLTLTGEITVTTDAGEAKLAAHESAAVSFGTHMQIENKTDNDAAFLVIKTPNPRMM